MTPSAPTVLTKLPATMHLFLRVQTHRYTADLHLALNLSELSVKPFAWAVIWSYEAKSGHAVLWLFGLWSQLLLIVQWEALVELYVIEEELQETATDDGNLATSAPAGCI